MFIRRFSSYQLSFDFVERALRKQDSGDPQIAFFVHQLRKNMTKSVEEVADAVFASPGVLGVHKNVKHEFIG